MTAKKKVAPKEYLKVEKTEEAPVVAEEVPTPAVGVPTQPVAIGKCTCCIKTFDFAHGICDVCESAVVPISGDSNG